MRFVTIVKHIENLELRKDTGQIPYHIGKISGVVSSLVSYYYTLKGGVDQGPVLIPPMMNVGVDYPFLETEVKGLGLHFLQYEGRGKFYDKSIYRYLLKNSSKIDVLHLFHFNAENIFYTLLYKILNPTGKVYLKLDINIPFYKSREHFFNIHKNTFGRVKIFLISSILQPLFFRLVHTISAESKIGATYFAERFKIPSKKMFLLQNGVDREKIDVYIPKTKNFQEKENLIITVGKIGTKEKNNEMLLKALSTIELTDWKVLFIGGIEDEFKSIIDVFFKENPEKIDQVIFTGRINSAPALYDCYNKAKIFCLTSINEGFPLAACEAAYFGNHLILTEQIVCFDELTDNGKYGKKIKKDNVQELAGYLKQLMGNEEKLKESCEMTKAHALANLTWQALIPKLYNRLNGV
jgi:glycosyltransferase involved in cell wall biosynthesis